MSGYRTHRTREDYDALFAPRTCERCDGPMPVAELSFGWDVTGCPTLVVGHACQTDGCDRKPNVTITSMRDGGFHLRGVVTAERIDPPTDEEVEAFERADAEMREEARKLDRKHRRKGWVKA